MSSRRRFDPEHAGHGSALARLIYAYRQSDGAYVCVADVPSGLNEDLRCPAPSCRAPLVARKGPTGRTEHFAHFTGRGEDCEAGRETSAHLLSKDILAEALELKLSAVVAELDGETITVSPERTLSFDTAVLEDRLGDLIPDVVLHIGDKRLLVEVRVTHACDATKIAKLKAQDLPTVEIDIRKAQHGDRATIARAILSDAPRVWLHNAKLDEALAELRRRADARRAEAARSLEKRARDLLKLRASPASTSEGRAAMERLKMLDLEAVLTSGIQGRVFTVPDPEWQALLFAKVLIPDYADHLDGSFGVAWLVDWGRKTRLIHEGLAPKWAEGLFEAVMTLEPGFRTATASFTAFLETQEAAGRLESAGKGRWRRTSTFASEISDRQAQLKRTHDRLAAAERRVDALIAIVGEDAEGFVFGSWATAPIADLGVPLDAVVRGDQWNDLDEGLSRLDRVLSWGDRVAPDRMFGLPLSAGLDRSVAAFHRRQAEADAERLRALQQAAEDRLEQVRRAFSAILPSTEVEARLDGFFRGRKSTVREEALAGAEGRDLALRWAHAEAERQAVNRRTADIADGFRQQIIDAAIKRLGPDTGRFWAATANPKLGGQRPQEYSTNQKALNHCLTVLAGQAKSGRR